MVSGLHLHHTMPILFDLFIPDICMNVAVTFLKGMQRLPSIWHTQQLPSPGQDLQITRFPTKCNTACHKHGHGPMRASGNSASQPRLLWQELTRLCSHAGKLSSPGCKEELIQVWSTAINLNRPTPKPSTKELKRQRPGSCQSVLLSIYEVEGTAEHCKMKMHAQRCDIGHGSKHSKSQI